MKWGYTKAEIKVKEDEMIMRVGNVPVLKASTHQNQL